MKTIGAFGYFDLEGQRSWVIRKGLQEHGFAIDFCRTDAKGYGPKIRDLKKRWSEIGNAVDALYVAFPGHYLMPLARRLANRRHIPVVFDTFLSLYETEVEDRQRIGPWHPKAWFLRFIDRRACRLADVILIDTEEHRDYFVERYGVPKEKFLVIPVGCRTDLFTTGAYSLLTTHYHNTPSATHRPDRPFVVKFHGSFIPLHGIETILGAAKELAGEHILFEFTGRGQTYPAMRALAEKLKLTNVRFLDPLPLKDIPSFIAGADVCLGVFGTGGKASRVIPTKAYEILAMGKPLLTGRTPAASRVFTDRKDVLFAIPGDPHDLAAKILELRSNPALRAAIGENGLKTFRERFQPKTVVWPLAEWLRLNSQRS